MEDKLVYALRIIYKREDWQARRLVWKINSFTHFDTSEKTCVEDKLDYTLSIVYIEWLALLVVIVDDGIVMKIV